MARSVRRTSRWVAAGATALVGALVLAGCGRTDDGGGGGDGGGGEAIDDSPASGTVEVWAMGNEGEVLDELAAQFEEENPDVTIEVTAVPWESAHDRIATAIAGGETPDITMLGTTWVGEFAATGAFEPTPDGLVDESSFFEGSWDTAVVDDVAYGVPWYVDTRVLYYRTDFAEQAGVEPPTTWDEYKEFTKALQTAGAQWGVSLPPGGFDSWQYVTPLAWQQGGDILNDDGTEFTLDSPEWEEAFAFYTSFFEEGIAEPRRLEGGEIEQDFINGEVGAFYSGPFHVSLLLDQGGEEFADKFGVAMVPGRRQPHQLHRRRQPRGVRRDRQPRRVVEVRPVAERARDADRVVRHLDRPPERPVRLGRPDVRRRPVPQRVRRAAAGLEGAAGDRDLGAGVGRDRPGAREGHAR